MTLFPAPWLSLALLGCSIVPNSWAIHQQPDIYPDVGRNEIVW